MKIQIRLVGFLAQSGLPSGYRGGELEIEEGTTLGQVLARLGIPRENPFLAILGEAVPSTHQALQDGDVIQLVPRIGGG